MSNESFLQKNNLPLDMPLHRQLEWLAQNALTPDVRENARQSLLKISRMNRKSEQRQEQPQKPQPDPRKTFSAQEAQELENRSTKPIDEMAP